MVVSFDKFDRIETPSLILCNPGATYDDGVITKSIGELSIVSDVEVDLNFNAVSKLNFRMYDIDDDDSDVAAYIHDMFGKTLRRRYIYLDEIGLFQITDVEQTTEGEYRYKDVSASSCEFELANILIPYIDGTFPIVTTEGETGILDMITDRLPAWTVGHIDESVQSLYRTFRDLDTSLSIYDFLTQNFQDAFECLVLFDILNREINIYAKSTYLIRTDIHLTNKDLINRLQISDGSTNLFTALRVTGSNNTSASGDSSSSSSSTSYDVGISYVNPTGTDIIYNFDYYLDWMSDGLANAVERWKQNMSDNEDEYVLKSLRRRELLDEQLESQQEINRIDTLIQIYTQCADNIRETQSTESISDYNQKIIADGGVPITIQDDVQTALDEIDGIVSDYEDEKATEESRLASIEADIQVVETRLNAILALTRINSAFTTDQLKELSMFIYEGNYKYEYIEVNDEMTRTEQFAQMRQLKSRGETVLNAVSVPRYEFGIDTESFIFAIEFRDWAEQLETGCSIDIEIETDNVVSVFLNGITVNYEEKSTKLKFGSQIDRNDLKSLYVDLFRGVSKSGNSMSYY